MRCSVKTFPVDLVSLYDSHCFDFNIFFICHNLVIEARIFFLNFRLNHAETESTPEARSIRVETYVTTASFHYLFYYRQAQAYAFMILLRRPM